MSWNKNNKKNSKNNVEKQNSNQNSLENNQNSFEEKGNSTTSLLTEGSGDVNFVALADTAPVFDRAVASEDGLSITVYFDSVSPLPILPAVDPSTFLVEYDGVPVPIIKIQRDYTNYKTDVRVVTTATLSATYSNGTSGVNATLTSTTNGAIVIDGVSLALNNRVLVKNQDVDPEQNGIYYVMTVGTSSAPWVLKRATDADTAAEIASMFTYCTAGTLANQGPWGLSTTGSITMGSTELIYTKLDSGVGSNYIIQLAAPISHDVTVTLSYFPGLSNSVTNNKLSTPDALVSFADEIVDVSDVKYPLGFFDPIDWAVSGYTGAIPNGQILERRVGFMSPPVIYDIVAPVGDVVLHQGETQTFGGMQVHYFGCYTTNGNTETSANIIAGKYFVLDIQENTVRSARTLGGSVFPEQTETIGDGYNYYLVNYLTANSSGVYPTVKSIEFGITASNPKNYVIEVKETPTGPWNQLVYMYASNITLEYYRYAFTTALPLYAVRIRYRGDYYYQNNTGLTTIAARDTVSNVDAVRVSHFSDFRDSKEFAEANFPVENLLDPADEGWIAFNDGVSSFDWEIINKSKIWSEFVDLNTLVAGTKLFYFADSLMAVSDNQIYSVSASGLSTMVYDASSTVINDFAIYDNKLYVALESGDVIQSTTGISFTAPSVLSNLPPVKTLGVFSGRLWIGTGLDIDNIGHVYSYNGVSLRSKRTFADSQVLSMGSSSNYLFIGLGSDVVSSQKGLIYLTDGNTFTQAYNTGQDRVDIIEFNTIFSEVWAGASDGTIYAFKFNTDGTVRSTSRVKQLSTGGSAFKFLDFVDSSDGTFFWIVTNKDVEGVLVYAKDLASYYEVYQPSPSTISGLAYLNNEVYGIGSDGKIYLLDLTLFQTAERNVYVQLRDLAGNKSTTSLIDNIIFGLPAPKDTNDTAETQPAAGQIFQIKVPTTYYYLPTTTSDNYTYTSVQKWSSSDAIEVYRSTSGGAKILVNASEYTNNNNGTVTFATIQGVSITIFITLMTPASQGLTQVSVYQTPSATSALYSPTRTTRQTGFYESEPFYAPSLNRWNELSIQSQFVSTPTAPVGLESGLKIDVYVRSASNRDECLLADWGTPFTYSTINTTSALGIITTQYNIHSYTGKWLQFKVVMTTATSSISPKVNYVALSYFSARDTYFFTRQFDTSSEATELPYPEIKRGLVTFNGTANGGNIQFKYLADADPANAFEIAKYTDITPNTVFALPTPSRYIRFAIQLVSAGDSLDPNSAAIVDEFAVQLETGDKDLYWMNPDVPNVP
jgi:hypothetical protein